MRFSSEELLMQHRRELKNKFCQIVNCQMISILHTYIQTTCFRFSIVFLIIVSILACSSNSNYNREELPVNASQSWDGTWVRDQFQNLGKLEIIKVNKDSIQFELHASSGGHESDIDGTASAIDSIAAIFLKNKGNDSCKLEFRLLGDSVIIVKESGNNCFTATGVTYSGKYENEKFLPVDDQEENKTLFELEIFRTKEQDSIFRSLVGDKYSLFVASTQLISEDDDIDSLNAIVRSSGVRGLFTLMENIIMFDSSSNNFWAAVIDDKKRVFYFTNHKDYKNRLPNTIEKWRQNFKEYPVIYNK